MTPAARPAASPVHADAVRVGAVVRVTVPATSANLGPGFDSLGMALDLRDEVEVEVTGGPLQVEVSGESAHALPLDERHLVVRALRAGFARAGAPQPGLRLACTNRIPHGRGLGSSAAAVIGGLLAARACLRDPEMLDAAAVLHLATGFEGHPDNAAAALLGGFTISWCAGAAGESARAASGADPEPPDCPQPRAVRVPLHPDVVAVACLPAGELATASARRMLPERVEHADAAFNAARSALLVEALTRRPDLLMAATEDRLHQSQRAPAMPDTAWLVGRIRELGAAAVVSGAGPSVLVLGSRPGLEHAVAAALAEARTGERGAWRALSAEIDTRGAQVTTHGVRKM